MTDPAAQASLLGKNDDGRRFLSGKFGELMTPTATLPEQATFLVTKEHRRFAEFADTVRRHRYIGLC